ncbi:SLAP domain-containing protein [Clostridium sp.]|jgi:SLAP domain-containing protein|uniref:SLAP domain-containing protein n=1 Tax=Clostridium sp. TaxID=1506 RepID=UPI003EE933E2
MKKDEGVVTLPNERVNIEMHLNEHDTGVMSDFQKEFISDELSALPALEDGQVSIDGVYTFDMEDKIEVSVYLRNGLSKQINFDKVPLVITNKNGEVLAKQVMEMRKFGTLPPLSARPYKVYFDKANLLVSEIPMNDWQIQFDKSITAMHTLKVEFEDMAEDMDSDLKNSLILFLSKLPLIKYGDVNIQLFRAIKRTDNSIFMTFVISNGCDKIIKLEKLPILIEDEQGETVVKGIFEFENVSVNNHKAKAYDFIITKDYILNKDFNLDNCKVYFKD